MSRRSTQRIAAAIAAVSLIAGGAVAGATAASAHPGDNRPSSSTNKPSHHAQVFDRWLDEQVDRTVTDEAQATFDAVRAEAREALKAAMEAAGDDRDAKEAARAEFRTAMSTAVTAFDQATLPADQVQPVADYREALVVAKTTRNNTEAAAKADFNAARTELRATYDAAKEAATTDDERRDARQTFRSGMREAKGELKAAKQAAKDTFRADIATAQDALVAALNPAS
jgi:hypothetical protein